jgi:hypothetical protein
MGEVLVRYRRLFAVLACASFLFCPTLLTVFHHCDHHHHVAGQVGSCGCACHNLSLPWHHPIDVLHESCLEANSLFRPLLQSVVQLLPLEYGALCERAPPIRVS